MRHGDNYRGTVSVTANTTQVAMSEASHTFNGGRRRHLGRGSYVPASGHLDISVNDRTRATLANHRQVQVTAAEASHLDFTMVPSAGHGGRVLPVT